MALLFLSLGCKRNGVSLVRRWSLHPVGPHQLNYPIIQYSWQKYNMKFARFN